MCFCMLSKKKNKTGKDTWKNMKNVLEEEP